MSTIPSKEQTLALAGVIQAADLVNQLARKGHADESAMKTITRSILILDAINVESIFSGIEGLMNGLIAIRNKLGEKLKPTDAEIIRYTMSMLQLQGRLRANQGLIKVMGERIDGITRVHSGTESVGLSIYAAMAELYTDTVSQLQPRIIVKGEQGHLNDRLVVEKVRTALLGGVRAAYLWHQLGGRRWHLLFFRKAYARQADAALAKIEA